MKYSKVSYSNLSSKQKEAYNFAHLSALLSEFGLSSIWLQDDWQGADCLAQTADNEFLKIQLKGRLTFDKKYIGKKIYIAFPHDNGFYVYPHDKVLKQYQERFSNTSSWNDRGQYSMKKLNQGDTNILKGYFVSKTMDSITL
tara:strand:+ start:48 stop:473 length:426 start_codon:yes stop_codon:yes gene_type:complete